MIDNLLNSTQMRNATKEEIESTDAYINSISEIMIPLSVLHKIKQDIENLKGTFPNKYYLKIIDRYIKEYK